MTIVQRLIRQIQAAVHTAVLIAMFAGGGAAVAGTYPSGPVTVVVPFSAGGGSDSVARLISAKLGARLNQTFIVENKVGASGNIGAQAAARAEPDGYTLAVLLGPLAQNVAIFRNPGFDLQKDFKPLAHMASVDLVIAARKALPLLAWCRPSSCARALPSKPPRVLLMIAWSTRAWERSWTGSALVRDSGCVV